MNEAERKLYNQNKLQEMYPFFRARIEAVLRGMEFAGYPPRVQAAEGFPGRLNKDPLAQWHGP